jgi:hypothetical protein
MSPGALRLASAQIMGFTVAASQKPFDDAIIGNSDG